jgi:NAD-dependent deacetylase
VLQTVITQNVDGLHQMAGNTDVVEFHGSFAWHKCMDCGSRRPNSNLDLERLPPRCDCGGIFRPELVIFGEMIPPHHLMRSEQIASECDVMLVVGTSAIVQPAAMVPVIAKNAGATVIEINKGPTPLTGSISSYAIMGKAGEVISDIVAELELIMYQQ